MVAQTLVCPQCGGQLAPVTATEAVIRCTYCGATALLSEGRMRTFVHYRQRPASTVEATREQVVAQLARMGLKSPGAVEGREVAVPFLVRPVRLERDTNAIYLHSEWWVNFKEGLLGIPLQAESPVKLLHALDVDEFEEIAEAIPADLRLQTENFDDLVRMQLRDKLNSQDKLFLLWQGDYCLVDLLLAVFDITYEIPPAELARWRNVAAGGHYRAVFDLRDGKMLEWNTPFRKSKGVNKGAIAAVVVLVLLLFVLPAVAAVLAFALPFLIAVVGAIVAAGVGA